MLNTMWTGPDGFMTTSTAQPVMGSNTTYTSTAMVSSFGRDQSGMYNCTAVISAMPSNSFFADGVLSGTARISVGEDLYLMMLCHRIALYVLKFCVFCME